VRGERVRVRANQIVLWATLSRQRVNEANPSAIPFPVILDTGHSHTFSISGRHLIEWAGFQPDSLSISGAVRERGQRVPLRAANISVHPNTPGERDRLIDRLPHLIAAPLAIAVYPRASDFPRLPILGLRAIAENRLVLKVNGMRRETTLRASRRWWPFG
jgi:hypothetical protein